MKLIGVLFFLIFPLILAGCSSSNDAAGNDPDMVAAAADDTSEITQDDVAEDSVTRIPPMKSWIPKYIQTGLASGIMVEFTGVKKDKPLHARYSAIELFRYPAAGESADRSAGQLTLNGEGNDFVPAPFDVDRVASIALTTTINDVKQAFFKVPPGAYIFRQTREWAEQSYISGVIVRDGSYSVIMIPVKIPAKVPGAGQP